MKIKKYSNGYIVLKIKNTYNVTTEDKKNNFMEESPTNIQKNNVQKDFNSILNLDDFYENAEKNIEVINKKIEGIEIMYKNEVVKYFAEDEKKLSLEQFVNIFKRFYVDLKEGVEFYNFYHRKKQKEKTKTKK